eukprot:symbB.v1.2.016281.t1/scaffold1235.1/size130242/12
MGDSAEGGQVQFDLLRQWWFYVIMFFCIYAFSVAVHLYFDYRQWESERVKLVLQEASETTASASEDTERHRAEEGAKKEK